jgi:hypothetical protein
LIVAYSELRVASGIVRVRVMVTAGGIELGLWIVSTGDRLEVMVID